LVITQQTHHQPATSAYQQHQPASNISQPATSASQQHQLASNTSQQATSAYQQHDPTSVINVLGQQPEHHS